MAAQGWVELGDHLEVNEELAQITPELRAHPDVLGVRWQIYAHARQWEACLDLGEAILVLDPGRPCGWIFKSIALHKLARTKEAFDLLSPVAAKFPKEWPVPYNLACYCAQLKRMAECMEWFEKAMTIDEKAVRRAAIDDPDLKPLFDGMGGGQAPPG